jgi:hypothetical protein
LEAERPLIPAASAAFISGQPSSSTLLTSSRLLFGQVLALAWIFIRISSRDGWLRHPQPLERSG